MSQSGKILGALSVGFLVFVTIKGELPAYASVLFGPAPTTSQADATTSGGQGYNPAKIDQTVYGSDGSIISPVGSIGAAPAPAPPINGGNCPKGMLNVNGTCI